MAGIDRRKYPYRIKIFALNSELSPILTAGEAGDLLGLSQFRVRQRCQTGEFPHPQARSGPSVGDPNRATAHDARDPVHDRAAMSRRTFVTFVTRFGASPASFSDTARLHTIRNCSLRSVAGALALALTMGVGSLAAVGAPRAGTYVGMKPGQVALLSLRVLDPRHVSGLLTVKAETGTGPFVVTTQVYAVHGTVSHGDLSLRSGSLLPKLVGSIRGASIRLDAPILQTLVRLKPRSWRSDERTLRLEVGVDNASWKLEGASGTLDDEISANSDATQQIQADLAVVQTDLQDLNSDANESVSAAMSTAIGGLTSENQAVACDGAGRAEQAFSAYEADAQQLADDLGVGQAILNELDNQTGVVRGARHPSSSRRSDSLVSDQGSIARQPVE